MVNAAKRGFDSAARMGGEEFALLAVDCDEHGAYMLAERIRTDIEGGETTHDLLLRHRHLPHAWPVLRSAPARRRPGAIRGQAARPQSHGHLKRGGAGHPRRREHGRAGYESSHVELGALLSLAEALDVRDSGSASHCQKVGRFAELTARELGLPPDSVERVRLAGILHDVGRVGIPDELVRKTGPLSESEWALVRSHPEIGARMVGTTDFEDIRAWILLHHERPDGSGYPVGYDWNEVPLEARILGVADAYEAMTSERPYRPARAPDQAAGELRDESGRQFDAQVVDALLRAV